MAPPKRKRPERGYSQDEGRPSPHRPDHIRMSHPQQPHQGSPRGGAAAAAAGGAGRRQSRNNGRGGSSMPQSPSISHSSPMTMSALANTTTNQPNKAAPVALTMPTPASAPSKPQLATSSTVSPTRKVPENNNYLTPARVAGWTGVDSDAVVQTAVAAQQQGDALTLSAIFKEIISAALDNSMGAEELGPTVRSIVSAPSSEDLDPVSTFLSTLSSFNTDREKHAIIQNMLLATDIDVSRMRNELEGDLLSTLGLVRDTFGRVAVRKATHALYRQSNYNLLREETEGYSKLITEYFTTVNTEPPSQEVASETYLRVNALIGAFDLDIGRVLDVTLDVFANLLVKHGKFFVKFLRSSAWWPEIRGFEGMEWEEPDVAALPPWASPSSSQWYSSDQEKEEQNQRRERRDQKFWRRVGELGERAGIQAYFELGARRILSNNRQPDHTLPAEGVPLSKQQSARKWADAWIDQTGTLPPLGNDIAAQLLGFKLRFYASDTRDASDFLPDNLIYLAALLIKIGFISILDLYPHLYPLEEDMPAHKEKLYRAKKEKEQKERGVVVNALTMAGALPDEAPPPGLPAVTRLREGASKSESERSTPAKSDEATDKKTSLPEPVDQKYQLLKSLLCIGALPEALFILGRHSWLLEVYPDLAEYILRLGHYSLSKLYEATRPVPLDEIPVTVKGYSSRAPAKPTDFVPRRILRWAKPDARDFGDGIDYKFYWEDWVDSVPVCQDVGDVIKLCTSLLGLLGPECGQDVTLLTKIVRIATKSLLDDSSSMNHKRWVDFSVSFIAPALSFTGKNPGIINEVWTLFSRFDTATRYNIYQQWFMSTKPVSIRTAFEKVRNDTNHVLSRVSTQNTKEFGRKLAKISYASPGIVFQLTLKRLINYPNMIDTLVECVRYLTLLGYDCFTWTLVNFLLRPEKGDTQNDGMLSAPWLKNIATFIGKACQRNALMDPTPLLQFTAHQLLQTEGELYMQDVLEQLCKQMGGISVLGQVSDTMVLSLCAGPVLRTFTLTHHFSDDRSKVGPSARRFVKYLRGRGLAAQILIGLAQDVAVYVHREDQQNVPDKVVLFNLDKMKSNLLQYLEMLRTWVAVDDFDATFPGATEMMANYHIEPDIAFTIARASMAHRFDLARHKKQADMPVISAQQQHSLDVDMHGTEEHHARTDTALNPKSHGNIIPSSEYGLDIVGAQVSADIEMKELAQADEGHIAQNTSKAESTSKAPNPEVDGLVQGLKNALPDMFSKHPCMAFYVTFWSLNLPGIDESGMRRQYEANIAHFQRKMPPPAPERRGYPPKKDSDETRRARTECTKQIAKLEAEQKDVMQASAFLQSHLKSEMWYWFQDIPMMDVQSDALHNTLLQDCFLPRSRLSLEDAQFASAMLKFMHDAGVPGFRTIKLLDLLFHASKLSGIISMYSETEAATFGRFLNGILRELSKWHENEDDAYTRCAHGSSKDLPGFGRRFDSNRNPIDHLQYDDFCKLLYKWHKALFTALKGCLESGDFQQIRNSLSILNALFGTFPKVTTMVMELETIVKHMSANDDRDDIKITAASSLYLFSDNKITKLSEHRFRNLPEPPNLTSIDDASNRIVNNTTQSSESASAKPDTGASPSRSHDEINGSLQQSSATHVKTGSLPTQKEAAKAGLTPHEARTDTASPADKEPTRPTMNTPAARTSTLPSRSEDRNTPQPSNADRTAHALPSRPESQLRSRPPERPGSDRHLDQGSHPRYESRVSMGDYGRSDRSGEGSRLREASPGRRGRPMPDGRTPERMPLASDHRDWNGRDIRDYDERAMRAPPRDMRAPSSRIPSSWDHPRDTRDIRELRDRPDSRGQPGPASSMEMRRMHSNSSLGPDHIPHRREYVSSSYHNTERSEAGQPLPSPGPTSPATGGPVVNPARAALINQPEHERPSTAPRIDREHRRERGSRPHSPRRESERLGEERGVHPYHSRVEFPRDHREERGLLQQQLGSRDRRDETSAGTPTGPRGSRNDLPSTGASWEIFQSSRTPRSSTYQVQDPNYGRLNQPSESAPPSGPRSERPMQQSQGLSSTPPSGPSASHAGGVHPSRMDNIQHIPSGPGSGSGSGPHGNVMAAPSGPRTSGRAPGAPAATSPVSRVLPTGPAANDRGTRGTDRRTQLGTINNVLTQVSPTSERANDGPAVSPQNPPVRGRGSTRANGHMSGQIVPHTSMPPPHVSNHNNRSEGSTAKITRSEYVSTRAESVLQDDGRLEPRSHRDARRSERAGRDRSHSIDRSDRRSDERSGRNGPPERLPRMEGEERERSVRDKRTGDRDSTSRRDREGERSNREQRDSRRDRGTREDGRVSGHDRDRRSRGGGPGGDDGRKRGRDPQDQGGGHGDTKRRR